MKRQPPYGDANMNNPYIATPMQQPPLPHHHQRMQQHGGGVSGYPGGGGRRPDSYPTEAAEKPYKSSKVEWQWEKDVQNQVPSHGLKEGQGGNGMRSYYQGQTPEPKLGLENQANKEGRAHRRELDMEIGYEDNSLPMTYEGLERKFLDDIMKLAMEQTEAEDAENARHREKIVEINTRYQEKLSELRDQQAKRREEFLRKESQARLSQYQQAGISHSPSTGLQHTHGYSNIAVAGGAGGVHGAYASNKFESYRDQPPYVGSVRTQGTDGRASYPEARVYNNSGAHYY